MDTIIDSFKAYVVGHVPSVVAYLIFAVVVALANLLLSRHVAAAIVAKVRAYPRGAAILDLLASLGIQSTEIVDAFLRLLTGKLGGPGAPSTTSVPPAPKAAPPGTFRSSLAPMARVAGIALAAFVVLATAFSLASCAAFKQDTKTALNDVQIACIFEHAVGIDSMIPGQDAAILAGICHLDDAAIPLVATLLSEHRRAEAMEIARHAGAAPCGSAR